MARPVAQIKKQYWTRTVDGNDFNKLINLDGRRLAQFVQQTLKSNTKKRRRCLSKGKQAKQ